MSSILANHLRVLSKNALSRGYNVVSRNSPAIRRSFSSKAEGPRFATFTGKSQLSIVAGVAGVLAFTGLLIEKARSEEPLEVKEQKLEEVIEAKVAEAETDSTGDSTPENKQGKHSDAVQYKYVIVGTGVAGYAALKLILARDADAKVLFIGAEPSHPYNRPPLSKNLWKVDDPEVAKNLQFKDWEGNTQKLFFEDEEYYKDPRVTFIPNHKVVDLDVSEKALLLDDGRIFEYTKCLLATGGTPRELPAAKGVPNVTTFRTVEDFQALDKVAREVKHITVIGGGFLGSELAWGISKRGAKVTQVFPETGALATTLPQYLSEFVTDKAVESGIDVHTGRLVNTIAQNGDRLEVTLDNGNKIDTDHIVVAVGIAPSTDLGKIDLEIDPNNGGIVANSELAARSDLYVAGDVLSFYDKVLGTRRRIEHYDHSLMSGRHAAENMVYNTRSPYMYQPMFWSDLGDYGFEAVGVIDSRLQTVGMWEKPEESGAENLKPDYKRGVVYYLNKDNIIVGVLTWNIFGKLDAARVHIRKKTQVSDPAELKNFISLEHEDH